jgi:hypothetical protein
VAAPRPAPVLARSPPLEVRQRSHCPSKGLFMGSGRQTQDVGSPHAERMLNIRERCSRPQTPLGGRQSGPAIPTGRGGAVLPAEARRPATSADPPQDLRQPCSMDGPVPD